MNRWLAAAGTAALGGVLTLGVVVFAEGAAWGCDEGRCTPMPAWAVALRWGVPALAALGAGWWGARRAERTSRNAKLLR